MPRVFLCDFDGTISPTDIGAAFARAFSPGGVAEQEELIGPWARGEIGHRELTEAQCRLIAVTEDEARAFSRDFPLDPAFAPFVREVRARGDAVMVLSEGFDFYLAERLADAGLGDVPFAANRLCFEQGRVRPEFPWTEGGCGRCGNCKGRHAREWRARGYRTVLVGDGFSDRCGAREADAVLARGDLLAWCRAEGIPAREFRDFEDVARLARGEL